MHVDSLFLFYFQIFAAAMWRGVQAVSLVPSVPDRVQALVGTCVVIPCSFTPPGLLKGRKERVDMRLRFRGGNHFSLLRTTVFNSQDRVDVRGRTSLFGRITEGDCSVKMEKISRDDARAFDIALKRSDDLMWGRPRRFILDVVDTPETPVISGTLAATEGQLVTLNCSVCYHCPSRPPALRWTWERGVQPNITESGEVQTLDPEAHRPVVLASLSFTVSHQVKPRLRCEASYPGAKVVATSKELHVMFSPKDVVVQVQSLMLQEGGSALLVCSCKADPPASEYRWSYSQQGRTVHPHHHAHTIRVFNITRDMRVRCSATNLIGQGDSQPTPLNIHYKPVIVQLSSACVMEDLEVLCWCSVDSNPKAVVTWSVNGTVPPHDYNISVKYESGELTATLRGHMDKPQTVICFAVNALGNDSMLLLQGGEETALLLWVVIPAAAICLLLLLLSLFLCCCRKRARKQILKRSPAMICQDRTPLYINCTEVTNVYTNGSYQLVYQNCTPLFVHTKQIHPMGRRGGERRRRRGGESGQGDSRGAVGVTDTREVQNAAVGDAETAIYMEIL